MTAYVALRELPLDQELVAPAVPPDPRRVAARPRAGERMSVRDLLYGLLLPSGNDAAATLAQGAAGSRSAFVDADEPGGPTARPRRHQLREPDRARRSRATTRAPATWRRSRCACAASRLFRRIVDTPRITLAHRRPPARPRQPQRPVSHGAVDQRRQDRLHARTRATSSSPRAPQRGSTLLSAVMGAPSMPARDDDTLALLATGSRSTAAGTPVPARARRSRTTAVPNGDAASRWSRLARVQRDRAAGPARRGRGATRRADVDGADPPRAAASGAPSSRVDGERGRPRAARGAYSVRVAPASRSPARASTTRVPGPRASLDRALAVVALAVRSRRASARWSGIVVPASLNGQGADE